jgi:hypothetical protein
LHLKKDVTCKLGFTSYQKCIEAVRMLAYGVASDLVDEYIMYTLCKEVVHVFAEEYFREPNVADTAPAIVNQLVKKIACMLGSVDCMRWNGWTDRLYGRGNTMAMRKDG